jgi:hypothetical protein
MGLTAVDQLGLPSEQPSDHGAEELARRVAAVVELVGIAAKLLLGPRQDSGGGPLAEPLYGPEAAPISAAASISVRLSPSGSWTT